MGKRIRVRAIKKEQPNVGLYVQALVALARQLQDEEDQASTAAEVPTAVDGEEADHASR